VRKYLAAGITAACILAIAIRLYAQPTTVISFGPAVTVLSTASTGAVTGSTFALPGTNANVLTWQITADGSALSASLQVSLDGTNWLTLTTCTTAAGCIYNAGVNAYVFVRVTQTSRTGGTITTSQINTDRAYPTTTGASPIQTGHLLFNPDNTYDIGQSGANRPRNLYLGGGITTGTGAILGGADIRAGATGGFYWTARNIITSPADGVVTITNAASNGPVRLNLGPATSSFAAVESVGATIRARLADNSGNAALASANLVLSAITFATLPADANGTLRYCSDCTVAAVCAGGGTGAFAKRLNGVWVCN